MSWSVEGNCKNFANYNNPPGKGLIITMTTIVGVNWVESSTDRQAMLGYCILLEQEQSHNLEDQEAISSG